MPVSFILYIFFPHSGEEPALIVKWVIVNNARVFPAHSVTPCQANKPLAFGFTVFLCSGYLWVKSLLGTRQVRWPFTSKICCVCLHKAHRPQGKLQVKRSATAIHAQMTDSAWEERGLFISWALTDISSTWHRKERKTRVCSLKLKLF